MPFESNLAVGVSNLEVRVNNRRQPLITGINFTVPRGSFTGIIGASGCGKSTLIKTMTGLLHPSSGKVIFAGHPVAEIKEQFPLAIGYLPQFGAFHTELTVEENLQNAIALRLPNSVDDEVKQQWMDHIVKLARLEPLLQQTYKTLSGGQMRRMALAEELIGDPEFLLLDELTSGLDEFSDREMMQWLRDLAHVHGKTVILVTHATYHLEYCDSILFLHDGRQVQYAPYQEILGTHGVSSISDLFEIYQTQNIQFPPVQLLPEPDVATQGLKTARPPGGLSQLPTLIQRQTQLFFRDKTQIWLHLALILTFPALVAVFAYKGLPQVRQLTLSVETNIVKTLAEQLMYLKESFHASSLVSGLTMIQVILLTLMGANNGAREVAKEQDILAKELRAGLSPMAYVSTKLLQLMFLCLIQALWMAWFVKSICGFPGSLVSQVLILFATTLAMSVTCLSISAASSTPERASLLAIYLVGFQLPLSGAALPLPDWLSWICRPFIAAYWGWSGYLKTLESTRHYDIVKQVTTTHIAAYDSCIIMLSLHVLVMFLAAWYFVGKRSKA
ncbi:MAG: ABC transporter ATP-binding protein/permease [Verrucomicrobiales bacterium]|jgi:ABC-type multidrug transport system ATPase subunit|nr:ABC transporter ATP-binding protein/permease [Verrucomicrobiales bacterium]